MKILELFTIIDEKVLGGYLLEEFHFDTFDGMKN